ncbi:hypothetical protein AB1Y20_010935 [Prymnesium parvum]|uniref:Glycerophosphocholine acyltransferase 1 n=1 Tax=Prymnesium parvum TaxID=97485 RepID=A0AB34ITG8_PRYPA
MFSESSYQGDEAISPLVGFMAPLFSPSLDAAAFVLPIVLALALTPYAIAGARDAVPLWAHFSLVVCVDVAHVYASAFRTYLDHRELLRRPRLLAMAPPAAAAASFALHHLVSPSAFWSALSYYAIFHFVKQNFGLVALFAARARPSRARMALEKYTVYAGAAFPVLLWHASPADAFDWFHGGERFLFTTPPALLLPLRLGYCLAAAHYVAWEAWYYRQGHALNLGKLFVMGCTWLTWGVGTRCEHEVLSLSFLNLFHGIPFIVMVGVYCRNKWATLPPAACSDRLVRLLTRRWHLFVPCLVCLALLEDLLWDAFVWRAYAPALARAYAPSLAPPELGELATSVAVALLSVPQIVHYALDAYIWRFDGSNPGLKEYLLGVPTDKAAAKAAAADERTAPSEGPPPADE